MSAPKERQKRAPPTFIPYQRYNPRVPPTTRAQAHWVIQWGGAVPELTDARRQLLYDIALILRDIKPNFDCKAKLLYSRDINIRAMKMMFMYTGAIVYAGAAPDTETHNPFSAFMLHPPLIAEVTRCALHPDGIPDFPPPNEFRKNMMWARLDNTRKKTVEKSAPRDGLEYFDLREAFWQACTSVADRIGHRVYRISKWGDPVVGMGPAGRVLEWLEEDTDRLQRYVLDPETPLNTGWTPWPTS